MKGVWIAVAVLAMSGSTHADQWGTNGSLAKDGAAIDIATLRLSGGHAVVRAVIATNQSIPFVATGRDVYYQAWMVDFDCENHTYLKKNVTEFDRYGSITASRTSGYSDKPLTITPLLLVDHLYKASCKRDRVDWRNLPGPLINIAGLLYQTRSKSAPPLEISTLAPILPPLEISTTPPILENPNWERLPTGNEFAALYPTEARGVRGLVTMKCAVTKEGQLKHCVIVRETSPDAGFGAATLSTAKFFKMRPPLRDGLPVEGGTVLISLSWRSSPTPAPRADMRLQPVPPAHRDYSRYSPVRQ